MKKQVCVIVPAFNEARVIESSLDRLLSILPQHDIYVVSDGSTDETGAIARRMGVNIMTLSRNFGKARALDYLIQFYGLTEKYEYILFSDADSQLAPDFLGQVQKYLTNRPACVVGTVKSDKHGFISAYRTYEYSLTHQIFKRAQNIMQVITVAPGCASLYRSDILDKLQFSHRTLTEDFDLTLQIHEKKLGRIVYAPNAYVITQDPPTLGDYWKQVTRWYTGFWQNAFIHKLYLPTRRVNFEAILLLGDGLAWMVFLALGLLHPVVLLSTLAITYMIIVCLALILLTYERKWWAMLYIPYFIIFQFINVISYTYSFFRVLLNKGNELSWQKVERYHMPNVAMA